MLKSNDDKIKDLIKVVAEKRKSMGARPRISLKTNGVLRIGDSHSNLNIINDIPVLLDICSSLVRQKESFETAAQLLDVGNQFSCNGYSFSDWLDDFKARVTLIKWEEKKKELVKLENQLSNLVSEEAKTEMELEEIAEALIDL